MKMRKMTLVLALGFSVTGFSVASPTVFAADKMTTNPTPMMNNATPRATGTTGMVTGHTHWSSDPAVAKRQQAHQGGKDELKAALPKGKDKAFYRHELEKMGYAITAVNSNDADYLEYEVVKGGESWEVQVDFKNGLSDSVDIDNNLWKATSTKEAMKNKGYKYVYPTGVTAHPETVSDRARGKKWMGEKKALEQKLGIGHDRNYYRGALAKAGYQVTSVNDREDDEIEYEVVKGDTSYEVQIEFDKKTMKSTKVDVSTNLWETAATEKAKGEE